MGRSRRQAGHTGANAVTLGYLVAAAVRLAIDTPAGAPAWLIVHLLLLGAATNAIITWSAHFASAMLQQPPLPAPVTLARLIALNVGVVGVLISVSAGRRFWIIAGAALVALVVAVHLGTLVRTVHGGRARRFATTIRFYWVAAGAVVLGIGAGVTMTIGELSPVWYERVYLAHVHLGLLGWVGLTVLGTEFTLWPTALRTRMVTGLERSAFWCLFCGSTGLALAVAGLLSWVRPLAEAGLILYAAGVIVFLIPFVRTAVRRAPHEPGTVMLAASTGWLVAGVTVDAVLIAVDGDPYTLAADISGLVPWLLAGFVIQVLLGALSYLVPVLLGGAPSVGRRTAAALNRWSVARVIAINAGAVLVALPGTASSRVGWLLVAAAVVAFAVLAVAAAINRRVADPAPVTTRPAAGSASRTGRR